MREPHTVTVTFAFGGGYHGLFIPHMANLHSVCSHTHRTETGAIRCAQAKRASWKRGEWQKVETSC